MPEFLDSLCHNPGIYNYYSQFERNIYQSNKGHANTMCVTAIPLLPPQKKLLQPHHVPWVSWSTNHPPNLYLTRTIFGTFLAQPSGPPLGRWATRWWMARSCSWWKSQRPYVRPRSRAMMGRRPRGNSSPGEAGNGSVWNDMQPCFFFTWKNNGTKYTTKEVKGTNMTIFW